MTTTRSYRAALPVAVAAQELRDAPAGRSSIPRWSTGPPGEP